MGEPPVITSQQEDVVVSSDIFDDTANLVLSCATTGTPPPTIRWFVRGNEVGGSFTIKSDGTLVGNITEGSLAPRSGVAYYCTAGNSVGTVRSRDIIVSYACECGREV